MDDDDDAADDDDDDDGLIMHSSAQAAFACSRCETPRAPGLSAYCRKYCRNISTDLARTLSFAVVLVGGSVVAAVSRILAELKVPNLEIPSRLSENKLKRAGAKVRHQHTRTVSRSSPTSRCEELC